GNRSSRCHLHADRLQGAVEEFRVVLDDGLRLGDELGDLAGELAEVGAALAVRLVAEANAGAPVDLAGPGDAEQMHALDELGCAAGRDEGEVAVGAELQ